MHNSKILLLCSSEEHIRAYSGVLVSLFGGVPISCHMSWEKMLIKLSGPPNQNLHTKLFILDAITIAAIEMTNQQQLAQEIKKAEQVIVLNVAANQNLRPFIQKYKPAALILDSLPLEAGLRNLLYSDTTLRMASMTSWKRVRAIDNTSHPRNTDAEPMSETRAELLRPLYLDEEDLNTKFVDITSKIIAKETQFEGLPDSLSITEARDRLVRFMKSERSRGRGLYVVGEKGVGKTTLTRVAAAQASHEVPKLLFIHINCQFATSFHLDECVLNLTNKYFEICGEHLAGNLFDVLRDRHEKDDWPASTTQDMGLQSMLAALINDEAYWIGMYCHFVKKSSLFDVLDKDHRLDEDLKSSARLWFYELSRQPTKQLGYVLLYYKEVKRQEFLDFVDERVIQQLIDSSRSDSFLRSLLLRKLPKSVRKRLNAGDLTSREVLIRYQERSVTRPSIWQQWFEREVAHCDLLVEEVLKVCSDSGYQIVLFIDNIDAKYNPNVELLLLKNSLVAITRMQKRNVAAIIAMRNSTLVSHDAFRLDARGVTQWEEVQVRPPDLGTLLQRRVECIRESGDWIGKSDWFINDFLHLWLTNMVRMEWPRTILDIIETRHPTDVRGQLELFATVTNSTLIHARRARIRGDGHGSLWGRLTPQFCLRALVWGETDYYREDSQSFVPNVFNNGFPNSPFNALIRPLILLWFQSDKTGSVQSLRNDFVASGVPIAEVNFAINKLDQFALIRDSYSAPQEKFELTIWGCHFIEHVFTSLAYIQCVWWDAYILDSISICSPRFLKWNELEAPTTAFAHWLHLEERIILTLVDKSTPVAELINRERLAQRVGGDIMLEVNDIVVATRRYFK